MERSTRMWFLELVRFMVDVAHAYAGPVAVCSVVNLGLAVAVRVALQEIRLGLLGRVAGVFVAGGLGGVVAVAEAHAAVAWRGSVQEAAGMQLLFMPFVLAPIAVAAFTWLVVDSSSKKGIRSGAALGGAIVSAVLLSPLTMIPFDFVRPSAASSGLYATWMFIGWPLAWAAALGCAVGRRAFR